MSGSTCRQENDSRDGASCCDDNWDEHRDKSVSQAIEYFPVDEELEEERGQIRDQRGDSDCLVELTLDLFEAEDLNQVD